MHTTTTKQTILRMVIILLCAGMIAGGIYAFSTTSAAQSLVPERGNHGPTESTTITDNGEAYDQVESTDERQHFSAHAAHTRDGALLQAPERGSHRPLDATGADQGIQDIQATGMTEQQGSTEHPEHTEGGSLLNALSGIGTHAAQIVLVLAAVVLAGKGARAWSARQKHTATSAGA